MTKEQLTEGALVLNKKHGVKETIITTGKMRMPDGTWVDSVIYKGNDRFTGKEMYFTRELQSFLSDFELV